MKIRFYMKWFGRALAACAVLFAASCDDRLPEAADARVATEPTPVHIEASRTALRAASGAATRTAPSVREWKDGDAIQITAVFSGDDIKDDAGKRQYCSYKYDADSVVSWIPAVPGDTLYWPVGATQGDFTAYYIAGLKGAISGATDVQDFVFLLGDIVEGSDPLYCTFHADYGKSVRLDFQHLCTHLTLNDVKTNISDIYWLYGNADGTKSSPEIPNAYKLIYKPEDKTLEFNFEYSPKSTTGGSVDKLEGEHYVISRNKDSNEDWVDFYLAPSTKGDGETREPDVTYTYGQNCKLNYVNNHPYLSFTSDELNKLMADYHYELSVERSTGVVPEPQTDFPEKPGTDDLGYVHIPDLLDGIVGNSDVSDDKNQLVLKSAGEAYPRLLRDVDFKKFNPMDYIEGTGDFDKEKSDSPVPIDKRGPHRDWKLPRMVSRKLDGNYHSFLNVAYPIFYEVNNGEIYNLAIRQSTVNITVSDIDKMDDLVIQGQGASEGSTNTEFGILANIFAGKLSRLLLEEVSMTVHLDHSLKSTGVQTYSIGCVAGRQSTSDRGSTTMENVELRGNVSLTVQTDEGGSISDEQDICAGVIAGQNGATIDGITCTEGLWTGEPVAGKSQIRLSINGSSNVWAGGLVGINTMTIQNVGLDVVVDASQLKTAQCYVGGLCGEFVNEHENMGKLLNCMANVNVKGGVSHAINQTTYAYSYCGGIAGRVELVEAGRIYISGTVTGGIEEEGEIVQYPAMRAIATGGGFGYVTSGNVHDCDVDAGVQAVQLETEGLWGNYTGQFVGMTSETFTESEGKNNSAQSGDYDFVGKSETFEPTGTGGGRN